MQNEKMNELAHICLTHYYYKDTEPLKNIMLLPEEEAFKKAAELAAEHPETKSFYRFADFVNYYPRRKAADEWLYNHFKALGGKPELKHPYSFVLFENAYLKEWFSNGESVKVLLSDIPEEQVSFTLGDSCAVYEREGDIALRTKKMLFEEINAFEGTVEEYAKFIEEKHYYIEVQVWCELGSKVK